MKIISQVECLQSVVDELRQELEEILDRNEFGSYAYDVVSTELQFYRILLLEAKGLQ